MDFTLNLGIQEEDLIVLKTAGLKIVLAKPVSTDTGNVSTPNVAWQVFDPFKANSVEWSEEYGLYASTSSVNDGVKISKVSTVDRAQDASYYNFTNFNTFSGPFTGDGAPAQGTFKINNTQTPNPYRALTFGLAQAARINGIATELKPLNAQSVPAQFHVKFTPLTTVYVWLQMDAQSETVITEVTSNQSKVVFGNGVFVNNLQYDRNSGTFIPA